MTHDDQELERQLMRVEREADQLEAKLVAAEREIAQTKADRAALDIAVTGLRELETRFAENRETATDRADEHVAQAWDIARGTVSGLLDKIGGTRG